MYAEFRDRNRESWKFTYKGSELVKAAQAKVDFYAAQEEEYRVKTASALTDRSVAVNGNKLDKLKNKLTSAASQKVNCEVFLHEFKRSPDREFSLSMADVVFFGLAGHSIKTDDDDE